MPCRSGCASPSPRSSPQRRCRPTGSRQRACRKSGTSSVAAWSPDTLNAYVAMTATLNRAGPPPDPIAACKDSLHCIAQTSESGHAGRFAAGILRTSGRRSRLDSPTHAVHARFVSGTSFLALPRLNSPLPRTTTDIIQDIRIMNRHARTA